VSQRGRTVLLLALFTLTFSIVLGAAFLWRRPGLRRRLLERVRYGQESQGGVILRLDVAPTGSLSLAYVNVSEEPLSLAMPLGDRTGPEIDVVVKDASGQTVEQTGILIESGRGDIVVIPPGQVFLQRLPLEDYVALRAGTYSVHVERARLRKEEPRLASNTVTITRR
jgi:hypothetical protein